MCGGICVLLFSDAFSGVFFVRGGALDGRLNIYEGGERMWVVDIGLYIYT